MDDIQSKIERMRGLIATIKAADTAYFRDDRPIMSDRDYDVAVDLLKKLEQKNGISNFGTTTSTNGTTTRRRPSCGVLCSTILHS